MQVPTGFTVNFGQALLAKFLCNGCWNRETGQSWLCSKTYECAYAPRHQSLVNSLTFINLSDKMY